MMRTNRRTIVPAVAAALVTITSIAVAIPGPALAVGLPLEADPGSAQFVDGLVVVAPADAVAVTFTNVGAVDLELDEVTFPFELPYLAPDAPVLATLTSIGVDPSTVVHETSAIQVSVDTCSWQVIAVGDSCVIGIELLPQGLGTVRPFGAGIRLTDPTTADVLGETFVLWPQPVAPPPTNDDFVDAEDLSSRAIPSFQSPLVTTTVNGDTTGATVEPGEYGADPTEPQARTATVWYRYTSPANGFAGQLGYAITPGFRVEPLTAGVQDPLNPGLRVPTEPPATVDLLATAPGNSLVPEVPPLLGYVRMEPGHTVWFQVSAASWATDGPFTLELVQAPNPQDDVVNAYDVWQGNPFPDNSGWVGDGSTYHLTADTPGGPVVTWATHVIGSSGQLRVKVDAQTPLGRPSTEPVTVAVYRAPTTAPVTDAGALGTPVATATGGLVSTWTIIGGSWTQVDGWTAELAAVPVQPGRYYVGVIRPGPTGTFYGINTQFRGDAPPPPPPPDTTPPTVVVTGAPAGTTTAGSATLTAVASEPVQSMSCTLTVTTPTFGQDTTPLDCSTIVNGTTVTIPLAGLPDGEVSVTVTATDTAGNTGAATTVTWTVQQPPVVVITAPTDGTEYAAAAVPTLAHTCTDNGTVAGEEIVVDGAPGSAALPTSPGVHTVEVRCSDLFGNVGSASVAYTVTRPNTPPVAGDDALSVTAGQSVGVDVLGNDTDADGDALQVVSVARTPGSPSLGTLSCPTGGACTYQVPATSPGGVETWDYVVADPSGATDTGRLTVTVTPLPPPPGGDQLTISLSGGIDLTAGGTISSGNIFIVPPGTPGGGRIVGAGTVGTTTVSFNLYRPRNTAWFGTIRVIDASRGVDLTVPVYGPVVRIAPDGTYSATVTWFVISRTAPWVRPVTLTFSVRDVS